MNRYTTQGWGEDLFAYDDYHSSGGNATLRPPIPRVPYLVSEAVGSLDGAPLYRWTDSGHILALQAQMHAQVHNIARSNPAYAGLLGWARSTTPRSAAELATGNTSNGGAYSTPFAFPNPAPPSIALNRIRRKDR